MFEFTTRLKRDGNIIHLFANSTEENQYLDLSKIVDQVYVFHFNRIREISFTFPFFKSILNTIITFININKMISVSKKMAEHIDSNDYQYVFIHHNKYHVQSPFLIKFLKTKSIYFCAEPQRTIYDKALFKKLKLNQKIDNFYRSFYFYATNFFDEFCKNFLMKKIEKYDFENINKCDLILTNSYFSKENILSAYGIESKVIHLGGDSLKHDFSNNRVNKKNQIITMGSINAIKGFDFIIKAIGNIDKKSRPNLLIIGNSVDRFYLERLKEIAYQKEVDIDFKINIPDSDIKTIFQQSFIFVYASYLEPLGLAPLEAMSYGLPVIAIKEGGLRETVVDNYNGFLTHRDVLVFSNKIIKLLKNKQLYKKFSQNSKKHIVEYWNWDMAYKRFLKAIE